MSYIVIFTGRREWVSTTGGNHSTSLPLGVAWTDLAMLGDGDRDAAGNLLARWGVGGFRALAEQVSPGESAEIFPARSTVVSSMVTGGNLLDRTLGIIRPRLFFEADLYREAARFFLEEGLPWRPLERLAHASIPSDAVERVDRSGGEVTEAHRLLVRMFERLSTPIGRFERRPFLPPVDMLPPRSPRQSMGNWLAKIAEQGDLHPWIHRTDSFLALCWGEFWHAVEQDFLYRQCQCGRFYVVERGNYGRCAVCRDNFRVPLPRERLIHRLESKGYPRKQAEDIVREYHMYEQQLHRTKLVRKRPRFMELREILGIRTRSRKR